MAIELSKRELKRNKLRYILHRIKNDCPIDSNDDIKEFFETQPMFDGWHNFAHTWDVGPEGLWPNGHWVAIKRKKSMEQEWNEILMRRVQDFPSGGDN